MYVLPAKERRKTVTHSCVLGEVSSDWPVNAFETLGSPRVVKVLVEWETEQSGGAQSGRWGRPGKRREKLSKAKDAKEKGETRGRPSEEMKRRNSWSQMEGSTPGLSPYEGKVLRDEAESCCACSSDSLRNTNMARVEKNINTALDRPHPWWF